jgi:hypothetical protein
MTKEAIKASSVSKNTGDEKSTETKEFTEDMINFVIENARVMTYGKMSAELGLTSDKVSNIFQNDKRKLRSKVGYENYGRQTYINQKNKQVSKSDFTKPKNRACQKGRTVDFG